MPPFVIELDPFMSTAEGNGSRRNTAAY